MPHAHMINLMRQLSAMIKDSENTIIYIVLIIIQLQGPLHHL